MRTTLICVLALVAVLASACGRIQVQVPGASYDGRGTPNEARGIIGDIHDRRTDAQAIEATTRVQEQAVALGVPARTYGGGVSMKTGYPEVIVVQPGYSQYAGVGQYGPYGTGYLQGIGPYPTAMTPMLPYAPLAPVGVAGTYPTAQGVVPQVQGVPTQQGASSGSSNLEARQRSLYDSQGLVLEGQEALRARVDKLAGAVEKIQAGTGNVDAGLDAHSRMECVRLYGPTDPRCTAPGSSGDE
ncbi:MAG: hypothetical protein ABIH21_04500 [Patescibacteria group bacterium]